LSKIEDTRIKNKWPIAREGLPFIVGAAILLAFFLVLDVRIVSILAGLLLAFIIFFFRDPERSPIENGEVAILAPADGRVIKIDHIKDDNLLEEPTIKISIFMSVFNVHVNRIPIKGKILNIKYNKGKFFSANLDKASEQNENTKITLETYNGKKIIFVQIAGLIARRIACWIEPGDNVEAGQRFGLIRFGSRVDIYLPEDSRIIAKLKDRVKAGQTTIGYIS
jgi:phosphatidylserine decarboxylase